jgi:DNA-binding XRE family transcriptional regulator
MKRRKDPPGYPGDDAILKAFGENLRAIILEKGLSVEERNALFQEALRPNVHSQVPRALGIVVRQLRERQELSRAQLSRASGLSARFIGKVERGKAHNAMLTDIARLSFGLNCPIVEFVEQIVDLEQKLKSKQPSEPA